MFCRESFFFSHLSLDDIPVRRVIIIGIANTQKRRRSRCAEQTEEIRN